MALMDNHCSEKTLYLNISNYFAEKPDIKPLFDVIYKEGTAGSVGKNVEATFVGIFRRPNEQWPVGELRVRHMYELKWRFSPSGE